MSSNRLKLVYDSARWKGPVRKAVLAKAGGQCEYVFRNVFDEEQRCDVVDRKYGGTESLTVNHKDPYGSDPYDDDKLEALCRRHHGMVDGGRATQSGDWT